MTAIPGQPFMDLDHKTSSDLVCCHCFWIVFHHKKLGIGKNEWVSNRFHSVNEVRTHVQPHQQAFHTSLLSYDNNAPHPPPHPLWANCHQLSNKVTISPLPLQLPPPPPPPPEDLVYLSATSYPEQVSAASHKPTPWSHCRNAPLLRTKPENWPHRQNVINMWAPLLISIKLVQHLISRRALSTSQWQPQWCSLFPSRPAVF